MTATSPIPRPRAYYPEDIDLGRRIFFHKTRGVFVHILNCHMYDGATLIVQKLDSIGDFDPQEDLFLCEDDHLVPATRQLWETIYPNNGDNLTFEQVQP